MGLSNFPCLSDGMLPILVMNTISSVTVLKNILRSALYVVGAGSENLENEEDAYPFGFGSSARRITVKKLESVCGYGGVECSVCLCGFEEYEEVSELSCKHFFHRNCLEKWFENGQSTCPLCRSIN